MKAQLTREFYIPAQAKLYYRDASLQIELYRYEKEDGTPHGVGFSGKRAKPDYHYRFRNGAERDATENRFIESAKSRVLTKNAARAERSKPHTLKVGDVLSSSWGYDQTNVDFYQVVDTRKHSVLIQPIASCSIDETSWASDKVQPIKDRFVGEAMWKRADCNNRVKIASYARASLHDGRPLHRSWYA